MVHLEKSALLVLALAGLGLAAAPARATTMYVESVNAGSDAVFRYDVQPGRAPVYLDTITAGLGDPREMVLRASTGELFIENAEAGSGGSISGFLAPPANGTYVGSNFATGGSTAPHGLAIRGDELFVSTNNGGDVLRYTIDAGGGLHANGAISNVYASGAHGRGEAIDANGNLWVAVQSASNSLEKVVEYAFDAGGAASLVRALGPSDGVDGPSEVAIDPITGDLFIANSRANDVLRVRFDAGGQAVVDAPITGLSNPGGLAFAPWGELFVADYGTDRYLRYTFGAGGAATLSGQFTQPSGHPGYILFGSELPAVPEPGAMALALLGGLAAFARRRRPGA
ncbi:MAG TPA: PEP-CTERM sorting domain-containing protein [Planctomycetota bacterium]|nr:PEP-CTERM sorting domain-containing protein [Planctomycetota bacterium]